MKFEVRFSKERLITPTGLAIAGLLINKTDFIKRVDGIKLKNNANPQVKNSDIMNSYIGLLCQGKSDFESIKEMHEDPNFFIDALGIKRVPSAETLRQRMDLAGSKLRTTILEENVKLLQAANAVFTACKENWIPLDIDVSPFDNSNTKKEGVSHTYKGFDGYSPIFAYLGEEGYQVNMEFRKGKDHCQSGTDVFLSDSIKYAEELTDKRLLVRLDSGNDSKDNLKICFADETSADFIIKRNLRKESISFWQTTAEEGAIEVTEPREGKKVYTGELKNSTKRFESYTR